MPVVTEKLMMARCWVILACHAVLLQEWLVSLLFFIVHQPAHSS